MTERIGPSYQLVADDIRARIISGEYPVGAAIPSTPKLEQQHGVSKTVIRQAVDQLRGAGILVGHGGKGVYVRALPDAAATGLRDLDALSKQVSELQERVDTDTDLRATVERIEDRLAELYSRLGYDYPERAQQQREGTVHG